MEIVWADPPPTAMVPKRMGKYAEFARKLKRPEHQDPDNPGKSKWALFPTLDGKERTMGQAATAATNVRRGQMKDFPRGTFESVYDEDGLVYVRYLGEEGREERPEPRTKEKKPGASDRDDAHPSRTLVEGDVPPSRIREWARTNGFTVPERGRLPENLIEAYHKRDHVSHVVPVTPPRDEERDEERDAATA